MINKLYWLSTNLKRMQDIPVLHNYSKEIIIAAFNFFSVKSCGNKLINEKKMIIVIVTFKILTNLSPLSCTSRQKDDLNILILSVIYYIFKKGSRDEWYKTLYYCRIPYLLDKLQ